MIEETLVRIVTALESIAKSMLKQANPLATIDPTGPGVEATVTKTVEAPAAPEPEVEAPAPVAPAAELPQLSLEELNTSLMAEYGRLGNDRAPIDAALKVEGITGVSELAPEKYASFLEGIRALPTP